MINKGSPLTWFRNISFHLHPLVCGDSLLGFAGVVWVGPVEVMGAPELGEVVTIEAVVARDTARVPGGRRHRGLEVRVERSRLSEGTVAVVTHGLTWEHALSVNSAGIKMDFCQRRKVIRDLKVVLIGKLLIINIINRQQCILRGNCQKLYNKELSKQILKKKGQLGETFVAVRPARHNIDFTQDYFWSNKAWHEWCWRMW